LKKAGHPKPIDDLLFFELNKFTDSHAISGYLKPALHGKSIGLLSEAGTPCIADPGADIVRVAQQKNIRVIPLIGPSSILLALMASGFNGQNFIFHGYLPIDKKERKKKLLEMEFNAKKYDQTQIFIETPYRNNQILQSITEVCAAETLLCIASNITAVNESIVTKKVKDWQRRKPNLHKEPAVFLLYRYIQKNLPKQIKNLSG
jgi:16S rRNA (cytidine1402-2'-O)-methyltransferase